MSERESKFPLERTTSNRTPGGESCAVDWADRVKGGDDRRIDTLPGETWSLRGKPQRCWTEIGDIGRAWNRQVGCPLEAFLWKEAARGSIGAPQAASSTFNNARIGHPKGFLELLRKALGGLDRVSRLLSQHWGRRGDSPLLSDDSNSIRRNGSLTVPPRPTSTILVGIIRVVDLAGQRVESVGSEGSGMDWTRKRQFVKRIFHWLKLNQTDTAERSWDFISCGDESLQHSSFFLP